MTKTTRQSPQGRQQAFNRILDAAGLDRRGPHQMRHTNASLLLQDGVPITYVSRQLGHKDASITLRIYAHWLPNPTNRTLVDSLDDAPPNATQAPPAAFDAGDQIVLSALNAVVTLTFTSWNPIVGWLRQLDHFKRAR